MFFRITSFIVFLLFISRALAGPIDSLLIRIDDSNEHERFDLWTQVGLHYREAGNFDSANIAFHQAEKYIVNEVQKGNYSGRNFRFGVREHAMGAVVNGISIHGGMRPFAATFLVFSDYMRPAIRLAALMKQPVIYVFTHDSVFVGEDGPTHQPIEHVESLRNIPGLKVIRPADDEESKAAWVEALETKDQPTALILSRQNLPHIEKYKGMKEFNLGGYFVNDPENADLILFASGSEVSLALKTAKILENKKIKSAVISVPERQKLEKHISDYKLPDVKLKVAVEAGITSGWYKLVGSDGLVIGLDRFGLSGKGNEVGRELGMDAEKIAAKIEEKLN